MMTPHPQTPPLPPKEGAAPYTTHSLYQRNLGILNLPPPPAVLVLPSSKTSPCTNSVLSSIPFVPFSLVFAHTPHTGQLQSHQPRCRRLPLCSVVCRCRPPPPLPADASRRSCRPSDHPPPSTTAVRHCCLLSTAIDATDLMAFG
jgi:hypothetical protein